MSLSINMARNPEYVLSTEETLFWLHVLYFLYSHWMLGGYRRSECVLPGEKDTFSIAKIFLDMSNYMISEDDASALKGSTETVGFDVVADVEIGRGLGYRRRACMLPGKKKPISLDLHLQICVSGLEILNTATVSKKVFALSAQVMTILSRVETAAPNLSIPYLYKASGGHVKDEREIISVIGDYANGLVLRAANGHSGNHNEDIDPKHQLSPCSASATVKPNPTARPKTLMKAVCSKSLKLHMMMKAKIFLCSRCEQLYDFRDALGFDVVAGVKVERRSEMVSLFTMLFFLFRLVLLCRVTCSVFQCDNGLAYDHVFLPPPPPPRLRRRLLPLLCSSASTSAATSSSVEETAFSLFSEEVLDGVAEKTTRLRNALFKFADDVEVVTLGLLIQLSDDGDPEAMCQCLNFRVSDKKSKFVIGK
ncbi:hypothetical protein L6452_12147 [Arctium lappa]|uniref:Uncharacterized protein n=1 Tax=Arctium lappa TaxID=4217 RepID=A0ACB9DQF7_ARCLA|nr:hypothetical protein L6452_12147 [Arctium lappa]